ncbi:MAG: hypothetical protein IIX59_01445, partial [Alistipes sp.]|nr:hypothetical protein [Alistipes sp.]
DCMNKLRIIILIFIIFGLIFSVGGAFLCVNAFDYGNKSLQLFATTTLHLLQASVVVRLSILRMYQQVYSHLLVL